MIKDLLFALGLVIAQVAFGQAGPYRDGDIIFQSSGSAQCEAVKLATHSPYSHCGIIFYKDNKPYVYEAVQPVSVTPLDKWIQRGDNHHYVVKRLKDIQHLSPEKVAAMRAEAIKQLGKDYDLYFGWADDKLYCSELVWKLYDKAGIRLTVLKPLKSYDLTHPLVKNILKQRYGSQLPLEEKMVSPGDLFASTLLVEVAAQ